MPPRFTWALLLAACPAGDRRHVLGELELEYEQHVLPALGLRAARRWFWSQAVRSVGSLAMMGMRRNEWEYSLLAILLASAGPAVVMEAWWSFLLSQVPLKADLIRGGDFVLVSLRVTALLSLCAGALCTTRGLLFAIPAAWVFSLLGQTAVRSVAPAWFSAATLVTVSIALTAGAYARHFFDKPKGGRFA